MLKDKIAIVTSTIRGLGFEILRQLAKRGATVLMCSRGMARAENSASWIEGKTYPERLDMTNAQGIAEFMGHVAERRKYIDLLINNTSYPFDRIIWNKSFQVATMTASVAREDFAFPTGNTIVIDGETVML